MIYRRISAVLTLAATIWLVLMCAILSATAGTFKDKTGLYIIGLSEKRMNWCGTVRRSSHLE